MHCPCLDFWFCIALLDLLETLATVYDEIVSQVYYLNIAACTDLLNEGGSLLAVGLVFGDTRYTMYKFSAFEFKCTLYNLNWVSSLCFSF